LRLARCGLRAERGYASVSAEARSLQREDTRMAQDIQWSRDFEAALGSAKEKGKLVLLDFSAAPM